MRRFVILLCLMIGLLPLQAQDTADEVFYAYGDDAALYRLTLSGEIETLQTNVQLVPPVAGAWLDENLLLANVPMISEFNTVLGILRPDDFELIALTLERQTVLALSPPISQPPYLLFGAEYLLDDLPAKYVALINAETGENWQLINELQDCGIQCVRIMPDNSRVTFPVVTRGLGSAPRTTMRLIDFNIGDASRDFRYEINVTGNYLFEFDATDDGAWWLITETNQDTNDRRLLFVDETGTEQTLPDATDTTLFQFAGTNLLAYDATCNEDCLLTVYPDVTGEPLSYRLPSLSPFGADWQFLEDGSLLMVVNRQGYLLTEDANPVSVLDDNWRVQQIDRTTNTLHLTQTVDGIPRLTLLDLTTLAIIAEIESETPLRTLVEANGDYLLLRDRNSVYAAVINRADSTTVMLPPDLLCKELTADGNVLCEQGGNVLLYNPVTEDSRIIAENMSLIDGF